MPENNIPTAIQGSDLVRGDSSTGDLAESQVGTAKLGGVSPLVVPHKKFPILLLLLIPILVIVAVIAIYVLLQARTMYQQTIVAPSPSPTPTPIATVDPTAAWQTSTNQTLLYEIKLPLDWKRSAYSSDMNESFESSTSQRIEVSKDTNPRTPCRGDCYATESSNQTTIGNYVVTKDMGYVGEVGGNIAHNFITYNIPSGKTSLNITFHPSTDGKSPGESIIPISTEEEILFDQILSTFKFTDCSINQALNMKISLPKNWKCSANDDEKEYGGLSLKTDTLNVEISDGGRGPYCGDGPDPENLCNEKKLILTDKFKLTIFNYKGEDKELFGGLGKTTRDTNRWISVTYQDMETRELTATQKQDLINIYNSIQFTN